jgi:hypothetical protein
MSTDHHDKDPPLPEGLLSSALCLLQGQFGMASTPVGGTTSTRGELFVSLVSLLMGGSYVLLGGLPLTGLSDPYDGGATIVESPSIGGLMAYKVMAGFWEQVISPVSNAMEEGEGLFSTPMGPQHSGMPDLTTGLLGSTLRALDMTKGASLPPQMMMMMNTRKQTALQQALGAMGGAMADGTTDRDNAFGSRAPGAGEEDGTHKSTS